MVERIGPVRIHKITIDRKLAQARLAVHSASESLTGLATLEEIVEDASDEHTEVLAAINGGVFDVDGSPIGLLVEEGNMLRGPRGMPVFTLNEEGEPFITSFVYSLTYGSKQYIHKVDYYNRNGAGRVCLYSEAYPHAIPMPSGCLAIEIKTPGGELRADRETHGIISKVHVIDAATRMHSIPNILLVRIIDDNIDPVSHRHFPNQLVDFIPELKGRIWGGKIKNAIGGRNILINNGKLTREMRNMKYAGTPENKKPRTAVGFSHDRQKLFLVVVEGRHSGSVGMGLYELARYFEELKVESAINLDGGYSSGMWLPGRGIISHPDKERPINNILFIAKENIPAAS
jgi:uncharacterized protein YigE (DUF2233 family)